MRQLNGVYAQWFNRRHVRVGHLFEGRYKAVLVQEGEHFERALRYVVRNPVRAGLTLWRPRVAMDESRSDGRCCA